MLKLSRFRIFYHRVFIFIKNGIFDAFDFRLWNFIGSEQNGNKKCYKDKQTDDVIDLYAIDVF